MDENTITIEFTEAEFRKLCLCWGTFDPCQCPACRALTEKLVAGAEGFMAAPAVLDELAAQIEG